MSKSTRNGERGVCCIEFFCFRNLFRWAIWGFYEYLTTGSWLYEQKCSSCARICFSRKERVQKYYSQDNHYDDDPHPWDSIFTARCTSMGSSSHNRGMWRVMGKVSFSGGLILSLNMLHLFILVHVYSRYLRHHSDERWWPQGAHYTLVYRSWLDIFLHFLW